MKKVIIAVMAIGALSFASCKKEYVCKCQKTYTGGSGSVTVDDGNYTFKDTQARAETKCNDQEGTGSDVAGNYSRECAIQ
ncbi:MAG: hypothetical protein K0S33_3388 [Bacteroidetes bacterium]|jgi:hypothetical protein|nr:hypothetical protein [Bacteroidota bacterium]